MKVLPPSVLIAFLLVFSGPSAVRAQSQAAASANDAAYALFSSGDYTSAAAAYEKLLKDYPTDGIVPVATIQLAFSQFFLGKYDEAQATLAKVLSGPPLTPDAAQVADNFLPQILAAKAAALPLTDPKRKTAFEDAIAKYTAFITKYPQSPDLESAVFGRALANYQVENFDKTVEDLQSNVQKFAQSGTIASSKNLLALALATLGGRELVKDAGDKAKGMANLKQGEDLLRQVIAEKKDVGLINDSYFQIGEILFIRASFSPESERQALLQQALEAYRSIISKEDVIALQQQKIQTFPGLKAQALRANNAALKKQLDKDNERELRKLEEIKGRPDQVATALLKMGEIFFNAQSYNQSRVLLGHVGPFLTTDDSKMRALYFTTMTYALQRVPDKAVAGYGKFLESYKGNPIAENLPFALGSMYLALGNPTEAIKYFDESLAQYPNGRIAGLTVVSKAQAQASLRQFDEALKTFQTYLAKNPPPDVAVVAQYGLAGIFKDTAKWDDAIAAYKTVKEKFPGTPQAVEADYWIAISTQQKGDVAAAVPLLESFIAANGNHALTSLAAYALGGAQIALNQREDGIKTLASLAEKFPDSQPAPYTYFMRAQIRASEQKPEEVNALMRQFIEKYPKDDKIFFAYDSIAQNSTAAGKPEDAVTAYSEFVDKYPDNPKAVDALVKVSAIQRGMAERLATNYSSLDTADQARWKAAIQDSVSTIESLVSKYPESPDLALGLQSLLTSQDMLVKAQIKDPAALEAYLNDLAAKTSSPAAKSRILFTLAGYVSKTDKPRALAKMNEAYSPEIVYSPSDMDIFGLALIAGNKLDDAAAVFQKLAKDYPNPPGTPLNQAPTTVQEAQATALFGQARIAQEKKQTAEAGKLFQQLKALYPWSPKVLEADYGIAQSLRSEGKPDEAQALLTAVIRATNATADLRANSFLLLGQMMEDKMSATTDPKEAAKFRDASIDSFLKIAQFYGGVPLAASEGLFKGGQLLEAQVETSTDAKFKAQQLKRAQDAYQQLLRDYPSSPFAAQAQARLTALGKP
jgi:TolA-binding protein